LSSTIDPAASARAYQASMLELVGGDDPAAVQAATTDALTAILADAGDSLRTRPAEGEWSLIELLGHMVDAELVCSTRYRFVLSQDRPPLPGYDQDRWVARHAYNDGDPERLVTMLRTLRDANLELWGATPAADRARVGVHNERGEESYDMMFRMLAGHDRFHLDQMRRTLAAVRASAE
jgi:hypothetical protein